MQQVRTTQDIATLGTILFAAAHPDDESFMAAGILAAAADNGQHVICVTATRGEAGVQKPEKWPVENLGETREQELEAALRILGIRKHYFLGYIDGQCSEVTQNEAVAKLRKIIVQHHPDTILTFGPDGMTGHPDHKAVSAWTDAAVASLGYQPLVLHAVCTQRQYDAYMKKLDAKLNIFFMTDQPPIVSEERCRVAFALSPALRRQKRQALAAMPSQTEVFFDHFDDDFIERAYQHEYFVEASPPNRS